MVKLLKHCICKVFAGINPFKYCSVYDDKFISKLSNSLWEMMLNVIDSISEWRLWGGVGLESSDIKYSNCKN